MAKLKRLSISSNLVSGLEETFEAAENYGSELLIEVISLSRVELDPDNPRELAITPADVTNGLSEEDNLYNQKIDELEQLRSLSETIRDHGLINPIVVYRMNDKFRLLAGERRTLASLLAGRKDIPAKIYMDKPDQLKITLLQWIENVERSDLILKERISNLRKIIEIFTSENSVRWEDVTTTNICRLIGCSKSLAALYLSVLRADEEVLNAINEKKITSLEKAAAIASIKNKNVMINAIEECSNNASLKDIKAMASEIKVTNNEEQKLVVPTRSRGRQPQCINFGKTKSMKVAVSLLKIIAQDENFYTIGSMNINECIANISDLASANELFKKIVKRMEEIYD